MAFSLIRKIKKPNLDILIILILGFLSITWFRGDYMIAGGDFGIPFDRMKYLRLMFYSWDETYSMGAANPRQLASLIPYALWGGITEWLGLSLVFWEKSLFYIWFAGSGLSMYYLCSVLGMRRLGKFSASIFYMMNLFSLVIIWHISHALIQMPYAFAPLYLGFYINGIQKRKGFGYIVLISFAWLLTTTSAYAWPAAVIIHWLPLAAFFLFYIFSHPKSEDQVFAVKFSLKLVLFWLALNAYWFIPFVCSLSESFASAHIDVLLSDIETLKLTSVKPLNALRLSGFWSQHGGYKGEFYYSYGDYHLSPIITLISFLIPFLVFLPLLVRWEERKGKFAILFFTGLALVGVFLIKGPAAPFGGLASLVFMRFPYITLMMRFLFLFFGIPTYLAFGVLFGYGILGICDVGANKIGKLVFVPVGVILFLLFCVLVFPFWSGEVVRSEGGIWPGHRVKVPDYYWQFKDWLRGEEGDFRIFPFPMSKTYNVTNKWEKGYSGGDIMRWFSEQPVINTYTGPTFGIPELIGREIENPSRLEGTEKLLGLIGAKYLIMRNDTNWEFIRGHPWWFNHNLEKLERFFSSQDKINLEKKFGRLDIYKISEENLSPRIFVPDKIYLVEGGVGALPDIASLGDTEISRSGIFFSSAEAPLDKVLVEADNIFVRPSSLYNSEEGLTTFSLKIPLEGEYDIFIRKGNFEKYFYPTKKLSIRIDGGSFEEREIGEGEGGLFSLGVTNFTAGQHSLKILSPAPINLLKDPSFEEGVWSGVKNVSLWVVGGIPETSASLVNDATEGKTALRLDTKDRVAAVYQPLPLSESGGVYNLSFDSKHVKGGSARFAVWQNDGDLNSPVWRNDPNPLGTTLVQTRWSYEETLENNYNWLTYEVLFELGEYTEVAGLAFFSDPGRGKTSNLFDNVRVERVFDNQVLLKSQPKSVKDDRPLARVGRPLAEGVRKPKVEFVRVSPTKYKVRVRGAEDPYFLIFSESFHPEWKAYIKKVHPSASSGSSLRFENSEFRIQNERDRFLDGDTFETWGMEAVVEEKHTMVNGFANSWYIGEPGDYEIILEFWPQRIFIASLGLSSLVLVGGLFYILKRGF